VTAREEARRCREQARAGQNPRAERRREQRIVPTFEAAARTVHAEHSAGFRNPKHRAQWIASLENDVFPLIGSRLINEIDSGDILKVLSPIWLEKPETARRLKQRMKVVFDWAKASNHRDEGQDNPTNGLTKVLPRHKGDKQHHPALPYQQLPQFVADLRVLPDMQEAIRLGLELLVLTATRTGETRLAKWPEVNIEEGVWTVPGDRTKSGRDHRIPLPARAIEILEQARHLSTGDGWIFPGSKSGKPLSDGTFLKAARRLTAVTLTTHGFRSSFRDWAAERTNFSREICEAALSHVIKDKTEAAYLRTQFLEQRRPLMETWARFVTTTKADVVAIA
jgi:integrase